MHKNTDVELSVSANELNDEPANLSCRWAHFALLNIYDQFKLLSL